MAVQARKKNILEEELYPNLLEKSFKENRKDYLNFDIMTHYELGLCFEKFKNRIDLSSKPDMVIFQLRGHYYLNLVNLYSTYKVVERNNINRKDEVKISSISKSKKNKKKTKNTGILVALWKRNDSISLFLTRIERFIRHRIINAIGYRLGIVFGTEGFALLEYEKLVRDVVNYANSNNIPIVFLGVTSRISNSLRVENSIVNRLDRFLESLVISLGKEYINIFGPFDQYNRLKFVNSKRDKISLNKFGHFEVAEKLSEPIANFIDIIDSNEKELIAK